MKQDHAWTTVRSHSVARWDNLERRVVETDNLPTRIREEERVREPPRREKSWEERTSPTKTKTKLKREVPGKEVFYQTVTARRSQDGTKRNDPEEGKWRERDEGKQRESVWSTDKYQISTATRHESHKHQTIDLRPTHETDTDDIWGASSHDEFHVNRGRDLNVQMEFPVHLDHSDVMEQFSGLRRQGRFRESRDVFVQHLQDYLSHPFIFVQFAELLLDMGDYKSMEGLDPRPAFGSGYAVRPTAFRVRQLEDGRTRFMYKQLHTRFQPRHKFSRYSGNKVPTPDSKADENGGDEKGTPPDLHSIGAHEIRLLHLNWRLLESFSTFHRNGTLNEALADAKEALHSLSVHEEMGSTEVRG